VYIFTQKIETRSIGISTRGKELQSPGHRSIYVLGYWTGLGLNCWMQGSLKGQKNLIVVLMASQIPKISPLAVKYRTSSLLLALENSICTNYIV
jgi:hypothetical protein